MRAIVTNLINLAIVLLVARSFFVEPISVETGSMATQLLGVHGAAECLECGEPIRWGTDLTPFDVPGLLCPRCGGEQTEFAKRTTLGGDRLLVNRNAYLFRAPRRWEIVAFRDPETANRTLVKRIVGLPSETISIRDGDLFSGAERIQKSLRELRALAIPVADAGNPSPDPRFSPWRGATNASQWETHPTGAGLAYLHLPTLSATDFDWLVYRPAVASRGAADAPLTDGLAYNQDRLRADVPVTDVLISFRARFQGEGRLAIRFPAKDDILLTIEPKAGRVEVLVSGETRSFATLGPFGPAPASVTAAYCDGRVLAEVNGEEIDFGTDADIGSATPGPETKNAALALGAAGVGVEIAGLRVERDVYYLPPLDGGVAAADSYTLGNDEYLMLGDNPARSADSRYWETPGVGRNSLLGRPFLVHGASRATELAGLSFQVPDFERIRYIPPASGE
jgi:signal peptidase I